MKRFTRTVLARGTGTALAGAFVTIYLFGTTDLATLYETNDTEGPQLNNPLTADEFGRIWAYVPDGTYDLRVDHNAFATYTIPEIEIYDLSELAAVAGGSLPALLAAIGNLVPANGQLIKATGSTSVTTINLSALGQQLIADTTEEEMRATLGLSTSANVQPFSALLSDIAGLTVAQGDILYVNGSGDIVNLPAGASGRVLTTKGVDQNPAWEPVSAASIAQSEVLTEAGTAASLENSKKNQYVRWVASGAKTLTVNPQADEAIDANAEFIIANRSVAGGLTVVAGSGVTINPPAGGTLVLDPNMVCTLKRVAENVFDMIGQTVAAA